VLHDLSISFSFIILVIGDKGFGRSTLIFFKTGNRGRFSFFYRKAENKMSATSTYNFRRTRGSPRLHSRYGLLGTDTVIVSRLAQRYHYRLAYSGCAIRTSVGIPATLNEVLRGFPQSPRKTPGWYVNSNITASFLVPSNSSCIYRPAT
jgi:hypothetical protein